MKNSKKECPCDGLGWLTVPLGNDVVTVPCPDGCQTTDIGLIQIERAKHLHPHHRIDGDEE